MISRIRTLLSGNRPDLYAILDIGTVEAKALLVLITAEQVNIVGCGRQAHQPGAVVNGSLADVKIAAKSCEYALAKAEAQAETIAGEPLVADRAVVGISGPLIKGTCLSLAVRRPRPQETMTEGELRAIVQRAERQVVQQAHDEIAEETGTADVEVGLIDADLLHVLVDGCPIGNSVAVSGAQVEVSLSNIFVPVNHLAAVSTVVTALELEPVAILSGCCALARMPAIAGRGDAIVIDAGGECTDIVLVRNGGIAALRSLPMGGGSLTRRIGRALGVPAPAAEEIKKTYADGRLERERAAELHNALADDVHTWVDGIQALLEEMAKHEPLPPHIFVGGGSAALPDLERAIRLHPWLRVLSFERSPQVTVVEPRLLAGLTDRTQQISGQTFVVALALAGWAARSVRPPAAAPPQRILHQVLHGMGLA